MPICVDEPLGDAAETLVRTDKLFDGADKLPGGADEALIRTDK
jgi:hypothetical protein